MCTYLIYNFVHAVSANSYCFQRNSYGSQTRRDDCHVGFCGEPAENLITDDDHACGFYAAAAVAAAAATAAVVGDAAVGDTAAAAAA